MMVTEELQLWTWSLAARFLVRIFLVHVFAHFLVHTFAHFLVDIVGHFLVDILSQSGASVGLH